MIISSGVYLLYVVLPSLIFSSYTGADLGGYFVGVFSKTIIPLALVGYEMLDKQRGAVGYQPSHIPRSCSPTRL